MTSWVPNGPPSSIRANRHPFGEDATVQMAWDSARSDLERLARRTYLTTRFVRRELSFPNHHPVTERLRCCRAGFYSDKLDLYDFQKYGYASYLSDLAFIIGTGRLNGIYRHLLNDKLAFHWLMGAAPHARPALLGYVDRGRLRFPEDGARSDLFDRLEGGTPIVIKPVRGGGGRGVRLWDPAEVDGDRFGALERELSGVDGVLVVEYVEQAEYSRRIYPKAANTIRMLTLWDDDASASFLAGAAHRFGTASSGLMDNFSSGGLTAAIDADTGMLGRAAVRSTVTGHGRRIAWLDHHPDSTAPISGVRVPHWQAVKQGVLDIADQLPYMRYLGWDILVTDESFKVIEANNAPDPRTIQIHRPLFLDERVRSFYRLHGIIRS